MNPGRYFMPSNPFNQTMLGNPYGIMRNGNIFRRLIDGARSFDWSKLLNGTSKTLNVVNQAIPIVKQAKPMVGNVKSMIKLARAFGSETEKKHSKSIISDTHMEKEILKKEADNNYPNFFI